MGGGNGERNERMSNRNGHSVLDEPQGHVDEEQQKPGDRREAIASPPSGDRCEHGHEHAQIAPARVERTCEHSPAHQQVREKEDAS